MAGDKVAGISFAADTTQLKSASDDLNNLKKAAGDAAKAADGLNDELGSLGKPKGGGRGPKEPKEDVEQLNKVLTETERKAAKAGISVGQFNNGMRNLPAQFTDVLVSLQGGMNPFTVLLQQGGQVKDMFGGFKGMFTALAGYISPATLGLGALAGTVGGLYLAVSNFNKAMDEAGTAIIESGGKAFQSTKQMAAAAGELGDATGTSLNKAIEVMSAVTRSGKLTTDQVKIVTEATLRWQAVNEDMAGKMSGYFEKIAKDPIKALGDLNAQFNFLTAAQAQQVINLQKSGKQAEATALSFQLFSEAQAKMASAEAANLSPLQRAWADVKKWASDTANGVAVDFIAAKNVVVAVFETIVSAIAASVHKVDGMFNQMILSLVEQANKIPGMTSFTAPLLKELRDFQKETDSLTDASVKKFTAAQNQLNKPFAQMRKEAAEAGNVSFAAPKDTDQATKLLEAAKKHTKEKKTQVDAGNRLNEQAEAETLALQTQLKFLQSRNALDEKASSQRKKLWEDQAKFQVLEEASRTRALTKSEQQVLAQKDQILAHDRVNASLGDQILKQQKLNDLTLRANKFTEQTAAKLAEINAKTEGQTDRQAQRSSTMSRLTNEYKDNPEAQNKVLEAQRQVYEAEDKQRESWIGGVKKSFNEYAESATDAFSVAQQATTSAFGAMHDTLMSWITTGKASFKDFAKSILQMLADIALKIAETMAIKSAMSFMGFSSGGYTGDGGKYDAAGVVHKGEFVMTKEATNRIGVANLYRMMQGYATGGLVGGGGAVTAGSQGGGAGVAVNVQVNVQGGAAGVTKENEANYQRDMQAVIDQSVQAGIDRAMKPGGRLARYTNTR